MKLANVIAQIELIMEIPDDEGSPLIKDFEKALIDAIKRGLWFNITGTKVIHVRIDY